MTRGLAQIGGKRLAEEGPEALAEQFAKMGAKISLKQRLRWARRS
jgi:hypothetical protein